MRIEPVGALGESVEVLDTCHRCKKERACEFVTVKTCRQTHSSPAEYDEIPVCRECQCHAEYLADPFNASYEAARASGWAD